MECFAPAGFADRLDRRGCFVFSTPSDIFLSDSFWSFRSPLSKYRIDRGDFFAFFERTDTLLDDVAWGLGLNRANGVPVRDWRSPVRNPPWKRGLVP